MDLTTLLPLFSNALGWHPSRVKTFLCIILGMIASGSVQQIKTATGFDNAIQTASICQRIRRFFKLQHFDGKEVALLIASLFVQEGKFQLTLDRTNWKFGKMDILIENEDPGFLSKEFAFIVPQ